MCEKCTNTLSEEDCKIFNTLPELEDSLSYEVKSSSTYIVGYIIRKDKHEGGTFSYYEKFGFVYYWTRWRWLEYIL